MNGAQQYDSEPGPGLLRGERENHPAAHKLECFMRGGGLRGEEVQEIVRHLLTECPRCVAITQRLWRLGERAPGLEAVLKEMVAAGGPVLHDEPGLI